MIDTTAANTLLEHIQGAQRILLTGPEDTDGDSLGACLALARCVRALSGAEVHVAGEPSYRYAWMPDIGDMIGDPQVREDYDLAVVLDGDRHRLTPAVTRAFSAAGARGIIDHHRTSTSVGYDLDLIDHRSASTCEMVLRLMDLWGVPLDRELAEMLYVGILFDTGGFRHSNTNPATLRNAARLLDQGIDHAGIAVRVLLERRGSAFRAWGRVLDRCEFHGGGSVILGVLSLEDAAAMGCGPGDIEGIVDSMLYVQGVEVAVFVVERAPGRVKLSLRSRGLVDVAQAARRLHPTGGGHARAAGVVLNETLEQVLARVPPALVDAVQQGRAA